MSAERIQSLKQKLANTPNVQAIRELMMVAAESSEHRGEAREILFGHINKSPRDLFARLQLAKLFYLDKLTEFAVRELIEIRRRGGSPAVQRLIESFGPIAKEFALTAPVSHAAGEEEESIVGELDIDFDEVEDEIA